MELQIVLQHQRMASLKERQLCLVWLCFKSSLLNNFLDLRKDILYSKCCSVTPLAVVVAPVQKCKV